MSNKPLSGETLPGRANVLPIAVDAMGSDKGPEVIAEGCVQAYKELGAKSILVGPKQDLENRLPMVAEPYPYTVFGIDKDKSGNIWFGTVCAGAFRYDGTSFLWIGEEELSTLPDGRVPGVRSMIQDREGYFWLSNFKSKYKITPTLPQGYEKVKAVELSEEYKSKLPYFNSGLVDNTGDLWMVTYGEGLWKYDGSKLHNYELSNGKEKLLLMCILQDSDGTIWLGTNNDGVYKQNGDNFVKFEL